MNTIELLEQIRKDFVKEFDNDPQINRVCKVMINEYKLRSEALNLGVVVRQSEQCHGCGESTGETKLWCCNHCGKRKESF